jgi:hypothetical protein
MGLGFIFVSFWAVATFIFFNDSSSLFIFSLILGVLNFWSLGILFNYKHDSYTPRIWGGVNILTSLTSIVFLIIAIL